MRPNRQNSGDVQYRRNRNGGRSNAIKITAFLIVAIGIVATVLVLTNAFEVNSAPDSLTTSGAQDQTGSRSSASNNTTSSLDNNITSSSATGSASSSSGKTATSSDGQSGGSADESSTSSSITSSNSILTGCAIHGRVTYSWGSAMAEVRVFATTSDGTVIETTTDSRGRYTIPNSNENSNIVSVSIALMHITDFGESFAVMNGEDVISLNLGVDPATTGCEINFDSWNVRDDMTASAISIDL